MPLDKNEGKARDDFNKAQSPGPAKAPPPPPSKPVPAPALRPDGRTVQAVHTAVEQEKRAQAAQHAEREKASAGAEFKAKMMAKQRVDRARDRDR